MHTYRTHTCGELTIKNVGSQVKLSGWVYRKRDHGQLLFIDLRDHYGLTQLVFHGEAQLSEATHIPNESVITITGTVVKRDDAAINKDLATGEIEIDVKELAVESKAHPLPLQVNSDQDTNEETRLKYRYLDLRREKMHANIMLRTQVISMIRQEMTSRGFTEFSTPILTSSSPEGARDFLVPSRLHPGKFYALPQAPQVFKQLTMIAGFDRYFQIAPCFRDEDSRADRAPGEFYQLDIEMSFVTQEDVFNTIEPVMYNVFKAFSTKSVTDLPFPRIKYDDSMLKYGSDKPDLRNPIEIRDVTSVFEGSGFSAFSNVIKTHGAIVRAIPLPAGIGTDLPRSFFDKMLAFAQESGAKGLAYIVFDQDAAKGPIAKFLSPEELNQIRTACDGSSVIFFMCDGKHAAPKLAGAVRTQLGRELSLIPQDEFKFCWITDFPFFELSDEGKIEFSHNPFSMPQGGLEALESATSTDDLLAIKAYQYDIVCNGIELSSGAIRNHKLEVLYKAFELVGYTREHIESKFGALVNAFKYGPPPHGGVAPGIDRIVMLLADEANIREVIMFPMNQKAEDLMMQAPSKVDPKQLRELGIKV
jgi:aspartyl-tRNA synthetase